jgi:hypothetical protein
VAWRPALDAVADAEAGDLFMLPPTYLSCLDVGQHVSADAVLAEADGRDVDMFTPQVVPDGDGFVLSIPPHYESLIGAR